MDRGYCIHGASEGRSNKILISVEEYNSLKEAKQKLVEVLTVEEKFNLVIDNYSELEKELINITVNKMLFKNHTSDWSLSVSEIQLINRRTINLLTTSRLYIDQVSQDIKKIYSSQNPVLLIELEKVKSNEYDSVLGYRVMEAMRNYVQHRGLPIHSITLKMSSNEASEVSKLKYTLTPIIKIEDIESDGKFKKTVLDELKSIGDKIDMKKLIREYIESLSIIHEFIRNSLSDSILKWDNCILDAYNTYKNKFGNAEIISIGIDHSNGYYEHNFFILYDIIKRRKLLEEKNSRLSNIQKSFVSSEIQI